MATADVLTAIQRSFADYLKTRVPDLKDVKEDFPTPSENLKYPCATVSLSAPRFTASDPYVISTGTPPADPDAPDRKVPVARVVGDYEIGMQIDIWCKDKVQRRAQYQKMFDALNPDPEKPGLNLGLTDYHGVIAHFHFEDFSLPDGEEQSQRKEWRILMRAVCTVVHVSERLETLVESVENHTEVTDEIPAENQA